MSGKTNFLNLKKPDSLDYYDIQDFNDNSDIIDKKAQELANNADEDRKRVDNLLLSNTIDTQEIGKTVLTTSLHNAPVTMDYLAANIVYDKMFNNVQLKDDDFVSIPYTQRGYVAKLLKPGLYNMKFVVNVKGTSGLPEIPMRIMLNSSNSLDGNFEKIKEEYFVFPATSSTTLFRNVEFMFAINEPTYIKLSVTNVCDGSGSFDFIAGDSQIMAIDWEGKKSGAASETADIRLGVDGQTYKTAGEAVRKQFEMILKNCSGLQEFSRNISGQISEHILGIANLVKLSKIESKDGFKVYQSENERNKILIVNETATGENTWEIADCMVYKSEENSNEERLITGGAYNIFGVNSDTTIKFYDDSGEMIGNEVNCNYTIQEFTIPSNCARLKIYVHLINPETFLSIFVYKSRKMIQEQLNDIYAKIDEMQAVDAELVTLKEKINKKIQAWFPGKTVENSTLTTKNSVLTGPTDDTILDLAGNEIGTTVEVVSPAPPYYLGDLWVSDDAVYICTTARTEGDFRSFDWMKILERK